MTHLEPFALFHRCLFLGLLAGAGGLCAAGGALKFRPSLLVYAVALIVFNLCWSAIDTTPRQLSTVFPLYLMLGVVGSRFPTLYEPLFASSVALLTFCTALTANNYWMA